MKKVKLLTISLVIVLIAMVAFGGVYIKYQNRMENKVKGYSYAMDLKGSRNIRIKVSTKTNTIIKDSEGNIVKDSENLTDDEITQKGYTKEEQAVNSEEVKTTENYRKTKDIIEKRLKKLGVESYIIKLDEQTGDMIIELPENADTDYTISAIGSTGKFEILDAQTQEVLMTNDDIQATKVLYGASSSGSGTIVNLSIQFNKEGTKKFEDITKTYVKAEETSEDEATAETTEGTTEENSEETTTTETTEDENKQEEKQITLKINGTEMMSTSFDEVVENGTLPLTIGTATTDNETFRQNLQQASNMSTILNLGNVPVEYELDSNEYILADITSDIIQNIAYVILGLVVLALIVLIVRYRLIGLIGAISYVGLMALLTLIIRYTNVVLSLEGILGVAIVLALNYIFINNLLAKLKNRVLDKQEVQASYNEVNKNFFIKIIPIIIMAVTFCFAGWIQCSSFGMVMFWGLVLIAAYNVVVTSNLFKLRAIQK